MPPPWDCFLSAVHLLPILPSSTLSWCLSGSWRATKLALVLWKRLILILIQILMSHIHLQNLSFSVPLLGNKSTKCHETWKLPYRVNPPADISSVWMLSAYVLCATAQKGSSNPKSACAPYLLFPSSPHLGAGLAVQRSIPSAELPKPTHILSL